MPVGEFEIIATEIKECAKDVKDCKMEKTCFGCKFLYSEGHGYSNFSWEEDQVDCAKDLNKNLPKERPCDWSKNKRRGCPDKEDDNWPITNASRCDQYKEGPYIELDVEGDDGPADYTDDEEAIEAICKHVGRERNGKCGPVKK